jgi:hypothetical protein
MTIELKKKKKKREKKKTIAIWGKSQSGNKSRQTRIFKV